MNRRNETNSQTTFAPTTEKSSAVGNAKAMREALEEVLDKIDKWRTDGTMEHWMYGQLFDVCDAALSASPRQCDVGTAEEQQDRFRDFCRHYESEGECGIGRSEASCPAFRGWRNPDCSLWWAQMPYEEGALSESQVVQEGPAASQE